MRRLFSLSAVLGLLFAAPLANAADNDDRVVTYLQSADELIADLKHIVVDLGGEENAWNKSVLPNIDIWLFGVDQARQVGVDVLFGGETGRMVEFHVPIKPTPKGRKDFLVDNLGNVGIDARVDPKNRDLYKLTSVLEGWLLFTKTDGKDYGSIVTSQANLPKHNPALRYDVFKKAGYDAGVRWVALAATKAQRDQDFAKLLSEVTSNIKKRPDETASQFELRKLTVELNTTRLTRLLSNTAELMAGWKTDTSAKKYTGSSRMVGLPGSTVEQNISLMGTEPSKFAKVTTAENAAMSARIMLPLAEIYQTEQAKMYAASIDALRDRIDRKEDLTAEEKTTRKELAEKIIKIASESLSLGWVDVYAELVPSPGSLFTGLSAVRIKDSSIATSIVEMLPRAQKGWTVKMDAAEESGVKIHLVDMKGKLPSTLKTHFGENGEAYVAAGEQTVWIAVGPDALPRLRAAIQASLSSGGTAAENKPVQVAMHLHPALQIGKSLMEDKDIEIFRTLNQGTMLKSKDSGGALGKKDKPDEERRVNRNALQNFKWQETALKALEGGQDSVTFEVTKDGSALLGEMKVEESVMRAAGRIIAKFTVEMLQ